VDVLVSTPRIMAALVEEAVTVGDLVRLFSFRQGEANLVELTLTDDSPIVGQRVAEIPWPPDCTLVTIIREGHVVVPVPEIALEKGDELMLVAEAERENEIEQLLNPTGHHGG
jgi:K+ transport systems, NAD-binding component